MKQTKICPVCGKEFVATVVNKKFCCIACCSRWHRRNSLEPRNIKKLTFNGRTQSISEWAKETGIPYRIINGRIHHGWTIEKTLTTPKMVNAFSQSTQDFKSIKPMVYEKICKQCGKPFTTSTKSSVYCSKQCLYDSRKINRTKICPVCGKEFIAKKMTQKFCSLTCNAESQKSVVDHPYKKRLHSTWINMKTRCYNKNTSAYQDYYGGRGITICDEWRNDFKAFFEWSLKNGYEESLTIDRIDYNGPYSPENCRWTTMEVQNNNKRNNRSITFNGETLTIGQWAKRIGIAWDYLDRRLYRGWSIEKALTTPLITKDSRKKKAAKHEQK